VRGGGGRGRRKGREGGCTCMMQWTIQTETESSEIQMNCHHENSCGPFMASV
jgi:hypothetical protein